MGIVPNRMTTIRLPEEPHILSLRAAAQPGHCAELAQRTEAKAKTLVGILLFAACLSLDAALRNELGGRGLTFPHPLAATGLGFAFAQAVLLGVWLTQSRKGVVLRLMATGPLLYGLGVLGAACTGEPSGAARWFSLLSLTAAIVSTSTLVFSAILEPRVEAAAADVDRPPRVRPRQFSLGGLFGTMTMLSLVLGYSRWMHFATKPLGAVVMFSVLSALVSLAAIASIAMRSRQSWIVAATWLFSPLAAPAMAGTGIPPSLPLPLALLVFCQIIAIQILVAIWIQPKAAETTAAT